jgi:2-methylcitrate dehydratase PrpD
MENYLDSACWFISRLRYQDLNPQVTDRVKMILLDTLGAIGSGIRTAEVSSLIGANRKSAGEEGCHVLGTSEKCEPKIAALINGISGTWHELDEGSYFSKGHAGIHVIPAALAVAETLGVNGKALLTAITAAYEVSSRIGISTQLRKGMHPHGTWGTVGAAIAAAKILEYAEKEIGDVINLASSLTLATSKSTVIQGATVEKAYAGVSGFLGLLAIELYRSGFTCDSNGLEDIFGRISSTGFDHQRFATGMGKSYEVMRNYFKDNDACCRYISPTLDALRVILHKEPVSPENIERIEVETFGLAALLGRKDPDQMLAAKFSIPYNVALLLIKGSCDIDAYGEEWIFNPTIRRLSLKVETKENPEYSHAFPEQRPSRVTLYLKNRIQLSETVFYCKGDAEDPYSTNEIMNKFVRLLTPVLSEPRARILLEKLIRVEEVEDIRTLFGD